MEYINKLAAVKKYLTIELNWSIYKNSPSVYIMLSIINIGVMRDGIHGEEYYI